jgi:excisionase family DNA binding protein
VGRSAAARYRNLRVSLSEALLTADDVAELLGVKASTVYEWVRAASLPCLRLGPRAIRFTRPLLEEWLAGRVDRGRA